MALIWRERMEERKKKRIELSILTTVITGTVLFVASRQRKKGRETHESNGTS